MAGPNLPVNVDATYSDTGDPSAAAHQQHHDAVHRHVNRFDKDAAPDGVLAWNTGTSLYVPGRVPLLYQSTGYHYIGSYASAIAQPTLAAFLISIGAAGRTDFHLNFKGQSETQADIPWLRDPQDTSEIGPAA